MEHKDENINQNILPDATEPDAGTRALTDAFQKAFTILKVVMIVIVCVFLFRGIFRVHPGERALVIQFGQIRDEEPLEEGLHWAWPEPIAEVIVIQVKETQVLPIDLFWYYQTAQEKLEGSKSTPGETLVPGKDGYCLVSSGEEGSDTGLDYNIVHAKWQLTYSISRPDLFYKNVYCRQRKPGESFLDAAMDTVEPLLKSLAADAIVETMIKYSIDKAIVSPDKIPNDVKYALHDRLLQSQFGINIDSVHLNGKITWPRQVNDKFEQSNQAKQNSRKMVEEANGYAEKILNEAGGKYAESILVDLKNPDLTEQEKENALSLLSGTAQKILSEARAEKTTIKTNAEAYAKSYLAQLSAFRKRPELVVKNIYMDAVQEVLAKADEKIFLEPAVEGKDRQIRIMVNRNPNLRKQEDEKKDEQPEHKY